MTSTAANSTISMPAGIETVIDITHTPVPAAIAIAGHVWVPVISRQEYEASLREQADVLISLADNVYDVVTEGANESEEQPVMQTTKSGKLENGLALSFSPSRPFRSFPDLLVCITGCNVCAEQSDAITSFKDEDDLSQQLKDLYYGNDAPMSRSGSGETPKKVRLEQRHAISSFKDENDLCQQLKDMYYGSEAPISHEESKTRYRAVFKTLIDAVSRSDWLEVPVNRAVNQQGSDGGSASAAAAKSQRVRRGRRGRGRAPAVATATNQKVSVNRASDQHGSSSGDASATAAKTRRARRRRRGRGRAPAAAAASSQMVSRASASAAA